MRFWLSGYRGGCPCPRSRRGWEEAHAAGVATGQDGGADKGAVLLPGPSLCSEAARPPLGKGLCHGAGGGSEPQTWCVALPCLLVTEPLPESATKTVLHPLRAPWAAWVPSWAPIPAHPCSQAPPALWDWGWAPPAAAAPPRVAPGERGLAHTLQSDAPHSCALQGSPHVVSETSAYLPCAPVSPMPVFPVRSRAGGRWSRG